MKDSRDALSRALWKIYQRPERPEPWATGGNLPWNDPDFSRRMLREHLDQSHGAASRVEPERDMQLEWLWKKLGLESGRSVLDVTCGPGLYAVALAGRGCEVTGVDFGPASVAYAREHAQEEGVASRCTILEADVREQAFPEESFDAALFIYGQLGVFKREEVQDLLNKIARALRPGGKLCVELLNQERVDKKESNWWYTDDKGLWGEAPYLHLGERFWYADQELSLERFQILELETGELSEIHLFDQSYSVETMTRMMRTAGFGEVEVYPAWDGLPLYDAQEWVVYVATKIKKG